MKKNIPLLGFVIGMLLPLVGYMIMFYWWGHGMSLNRFTGIMKADHKSFAKVLTMSLLINLIPFLYFKSKRLEYTMNGVVVATMLYAVYIVLMMFVW